MPVPRPRSFSSSIDPNSTRWPRGCRRCILHRREVEMRRQVRFAIAASVLLAAVAARGQAPPGASAKTPAAPAPAAPPAAAPAAPAGPAPHLKFDATVLNLGNVVHGEDAV